MRLDGSAIQSHGKGSSRSQAGRTGQHQRPAPKALADPDPNRIRHEVFTHQAATHDETVTLFYNTHDAICFTSCAMAATADYHSVRYGPPAQPRAEGCRHLLQPRSPAAALDAGKARVAIEITGRNELATARTVYNCTHSCEGVQWPHVTRDAAAPTQSQYRKICGKNDAVSRGA